MSNIDQGMLAVQPHVLALFKHAAKLQLLVNSTCEFYAGAAELVCGRTRPRACVQDTRIEGQRNIGAGAGHSMGIQWSAL